MEVPEAGSRDWRRGSDERFGMAAVVAVVSYIKGRLTVVYCVAVENEMILSEGVRLGKLQMVCYIFAFQARRPFVCNRVFGKHASGKHRTITGRLSAFGPLVHSSGRHMVIGMYNPTSPWIKASGPWLYTNSQVWTNRAEHCSVDRRNPGTVRFPP
jgi:hypothetical protein